MLFGCHKRAFYFFGGVQGALLYDNMSTVAATGVGMRRASSV
jgi:transposase